MIPSVNLCTNVCGSSMSVILKLGGASHYASFFVCNLDGSFELAIASTLPFIHVSKGRVPCAGPVRSF